MRRRWRLSALLVTGVLAAGAMGTGALVVGVEHLRDTQATTAMTQRVRVVESAVTAEVQRYVETSGDLAAAIGAQSDLTLADYRSLTAGLNRGRLPGISGTSVVVSATNSEIPQVQRRWRARGNHRLVLVPAGTGVRHLFSVFNVPLDGSVPQTGSDLSQAAEPTRAMRAAAASDRVTASATYVLLKDRGLQSSEQQLSFVLATPIRGGAGTRDAGRFRGWLLMGIRGRDFLEETMRRASGETVAVSLFETPTSTSRAVQVARVTPAPVLVGTDLERTATVLVAGRRWELRVAPTTAFATGPPLGSWAGGVGLVVTMLLAVLVGSLSTSRSRALARVDSATSALRADIARRESVEATLRQREEELHMLALTDSLTGLANRRAFMDRLDQSHARALRRRTPVCVLFCDVDHFKAINDTYGHAAGDDVLAEVAIRLRRHFRSDDTIGRLGGDEFAVICENGAAFTEVLLDRVRAALAAPYLVRGLSIEAAVSVGMASPQHGESSSQLLERADATMYLAKGGARVDA